MNRISAMIRRFSKNEYARNASTLMTGSAISMGIQALSSLFLARLYTKEDFGSLQVFTSTYSILVIIATLRYEFAILLPESDNDSFAVMLVSCLSTVVCSLFCLVAVLVLHLLSWFEVYEWLWYLPAILLLLGIYYSCNYWLNRRKRYINLAVNRILQAVLSVGLSVLFCRRLLGINEGMILAYVLAQLVVMVLLIIYATMDYKKLNLRVTRADLFTQFKRYKRFPLHSMPAGLVNTVASQLPVYIIEGFFGKATVGSYSMMNRVLGMPITVVGQAIADVFRQRVSSTYAKEKQCASLYNSTAKKLALAAAPPFILLMLTSRWLIPFLLGNEWTVAADFVVLLAPFYYIKLVMSPLTYMTIVAEKQVFEFRWQLIMMVLTGGSMLAACYVFRTSVSVALVVYAVIYSIMYFYHFNYTRRLAKGAQLNG